MHTYQQGVTPEYGDEEVKYSKCAKTFIAATTITIIDMMFIISCSFIYLKEYTFNVKNTYDETTNSYTIAKPFVILYLSESICSLLMILWIVFFIMWLIYNIIS